MWVRRQDGCTLSNSNEFSVVRILASPTQSFAQIRNEYGDVLGEYSTKEKALKVLDKIEKRIEKTETEGYSATPSGNGTWNTNVIFQMPQDEEVL